MKIRRNNRRKGAALVEYGLVVAGVAMISAAALSVFGHKVSDLIALSATVLPGAHADDNAPIVSGKLIETAANDDGNIALNLDAINSASDSSRMSTNLGVDDVTVLVKEAE